MAERPSDHPPGTPVEAGDRLPADRRATGPRPPEQDPARRIVAPLDAQPEKPIKEAHASLFVDHLRDLADDKT